MIGFRKSDQIPESVFLQQLSMKSRNVVIIAVKQYDNLGAGYMSSVLSANGFKTLIISPLIEKSHILSAIRRLDPLLIGFSVIFQYHIHLFRDLAEYLREKGIKCHFTAGGHYASLKNEELFEHIPFLDSIVRFEGEYTLVDLVKRLYKGSDWRNTDSLSYKYQGDIIENRLRPLESDLDRFPYPARAPLQKVVFEKKFATIIAGRGCIHNCSFCNVRKFYSLPPGPVKRIRNPVKVAEEMSYLHNRRNCSIFFFLDDDFPVRPVCDPEWVKTFCNSLKEMDLSGKIMWKICCRPDEIDYDLFRIMKQHGLFRVFLGIEDGTESGLKSLNKNMTVEDTLAGINILRDLEIEYDYGYMLFQPGTTFRSLYANLDFLKIICNNGYTPVTFLKLMPYYDTKVEKELSEQGRLKITGGLRDYDFLSGRMNRYYDFISGLFSDWLRHPGGVANLAGWGITYYSVYSHYFGRDSDVKRLKNRFSRLVNESNEYILFTLTGLAMIFERGDCNKSSNVRLKKIAEDAGIKSRLFRKSISKNLGSLLDLPLRHLFSHFSPGYSKLYRNNYIIRP